MTDSAVSVGGVGLFDTAGASASRAVADAAAERRDLEVALRRTHQRARNFQAAALSEPLTAAALQPLTDQGWTILHDRRWPGSTRANVDHLAIGPAELCQCCHGGRLLPAACFQEAA